MKRIRMFSLAVLIMACAVPLFAELKVSDFAEHPWTWENGDVIDFYSSDGISSYSIRKKGTVKVLGKGEADVQKFKGNDGKDYIKLVLKGRGEFLMHPINDGYSLMELTNLQVFGFTMKRYIDKALAGQRMKEAAALLKEKKYDQALNKLDESLKAYPKNRAAMYKKADVNEMQAKSFGKGQVGMEFESYARARVCYLAILEVYPKEKRAKKMVKVTEKKMDELSKKPGYQDTP